MITAKFPDGKRFQARDGSEVWHCDCPSETIFRTRGGYVLVETHWRVEGKPVPKYSMPGEIIAELVQSGELSDKAAARTSTTRTARKVSCREAVKHILQGVLQECHADEILEAVGLQDGAKTALVTFTPHANGKTRLEVRGELADEITRVAKLKGITPSAALREVVALAEEKFGRR